MRLHVRTVKQVPRRAWSRTKAAWRRARTEWQQRANSRRNDRQVHRVFDSLEWSQQPLRSFQDFFADQRERLGLRDTPDKSYVLAFSHYGHDAQVRGVQPPRYHALPGPCEVQGRQASVPYPFHCGEAQGTVFFFERSKNGR